MMLPAEQSPLVLKDKPQLKHLTGREAHQGKPSFLCCGSVPSGNWLLENSQYM